VLSITTALNEPINTIADDKDRKTGSNDRPGRTANSPTLAIATLAITILVITGLSKIRNTEHQSTRQRAQGPNLNKFLHLGLSNEI
jgi:hypothetical protein